MVNRGTLLLWQDIFHYPPSVPIAGWRFPIGKTRARTSHRPPLINAKLAESSSAPGFSVFTSERRHQLTIAAAGVPIPVGVGEDMPTPTNQVSTNLTLTWEKKLRKRQRCLGGWIDVASRNSRPSERDKDLEKWMSLFGMDGTREKECPSSTWNWIELVRWEMERIIHFDPALSYFACARSIKHFDRSLSAEFRPSLKFGNFLLGIADVLYNCIIKDGCCVE